MATEVEPRRIVEPHLAVNPADASHLLAGAFLEWAQDPFDEAEARERCVSFVSRDRGASWSRHEFPLTHCGDPQVAILPDGQAVFVALGRVPGVRPQTSSWLVVYHSPDGGTTWDAEPAVIGSGHDHPTVTVDLKSAARKGWIYVTTHRTWRDGNGDMASGIFVVRSRDGGKSFDQPTVVSPNALHNASEMPVTLSDGMVIAAFSDGAYGPPQLERRRAWVIRSDNGGTTFSTPFLVTDACGPPGFMLAAFGVDPSDGSSKDRTYLACRQAGGGPILVSSSGDRGRTWNRPGVPVGSTNVDVDVRRIPTLGVNGAGVVGVFIAERTAKIGTACLQFLFAMSFDGGRSFDPAQVLSRSDCGESPGDAVAARRFPTYGDYYGLAALPDGRFQVVWPQMQDGHSVLLTTSVAAERRTR